MLAGWFDQAGAQVVWWTIEPAHLRQLAGWLDNGRVGRQSGELVLTGA